MKQVQGQKTKINPIHVVLAIAALLAIFYASNEAKKRGGLDCVFSCRNAQAKIGDINREQDPQWEYRALNFCSRGRDTQCYNAAPCIATFKNGEKVTIDREVCNAALNYYDERTGFGAIRIRKEVCQSGGGVVRDALVTCAWSSCNNLQTNPSVNPELIKESEFCKPLKFDLEKTSGIVCPRDLPIIQKACGSNDTCYCPQLMEQQDESEILVPKDCVVNLTDGTSLVVNCSVCGC